MGWAEERERASEIVEQLRSERPSLTIGRQEEIIAAALQKVADECIEVVDNKRKDLGKTRNRIDMRLPHSIERLFEITNRAIGCIDAEDVIRARFPKEER